MDTENSQQPQLQDLQDQIVRLQNELSELSAQFYKNNFTSHQDFNKECNFSYRLKVPHYTTVPSGQVGEIIEIGGILFICSTTDNWTVVGEQVAP